MGLASQLRGASQLSATWDCPAAGALLPYDGVSSTAAAATGMAAWPGGGSWPAELWPQHCRLCPVVPAAAPAAAAGAAVHRRRASCCPAVVQGWCRVAASRCGCSTSTGDMPACLHVPAWQRCVLLCVDCASSVGHVWPVVCNQMSPAVCCNTRLQCQTWMLARRAHWSGCTSTGGGIRLSHSCHMARLDMPSWHGWLAAAQQKHLGVCAGALLYDVRVLWVLGLGNQGL